MVAYLCKSGVLFLSHPPPIDKANQGSVGTEEDEQMLYLSAVASGKANAHETVRVEAKITSGGMQQMGRGKSIMLGFTSSGSSSSSSSVACLLGIERSSAFLLCGDGICIMMLV